ncbi:hypothetical protein EDD11_008545 [Mortierella claussenii]|nr:hypothetical protein EDD11_008545 [Mortierella claussenii]
MDTIGPLQQLDQECTTWANQHAHSCNLLASLANIMKQREQTLTQWSSQQQQQEQQSRGTLSKRSHTPLLASSSLQLLIHKQTLEIESVVRQLYETIEVFKKVLQALVELERQVEVALQRIDTVQLLDTISYSSALSSCGRISSPAVSTTSASNIPTKSYASAPALMDTAEISPLEVLDWVSRIRAMYAHELSVKQSQIHPSTTALDRFDHLVDLQRDWGLQKRIDFGLEQEIVERIKTYRRVREYSSRV